MKPTTRDFKANARVALGDVQLQRALSGLPGGLVARRTAARAALPEFEQLRDRPSAPTSKRTTGYSQIPE